MAIPTQQQFERLLILGSGAMALAPGRRDWGPLLRRGWVAAQTADDESRFLPPLRITPDGFVALAAAVERYGLPELKGERPRQLQEAPFVRKLRLDLDDARNARDAAQRAARAATRQLEQVKRLVGAV